MESSEMPLMFTDVSIHPNISYRMFKGHKKLASQSAKIQKLKNKQIKQSSLGRYQFQIENDQQQPLNFQSKKFSMQRIKSKLANGYLKSHRQKQIVTKSNKFLKSINKKKQQLDELLITSNKTFYNAPEKDKQKKKLPTFYSKNFKDKMNNYLNLVVQKSFQDHNKKLKDLQQHNIKYQSVDLLKTSKCKNPFIRKMKEQKNSSKGNQTQRANLNQSKYIQNLNNQSKYIQNLNNLTQLRFLNKNNSRHNSIKHSFSVQLGKHKNFQLWKKSKQ